MTTRPASHIDDTHPEGRSLMGKNPWVEGALCARLETDDSSPCWRQPGSR